MRFLLDTNAVIAIMKGKPDFLMRLQQHSPGDFALPTIALHELYYGAYKSARVTENLERIGRLRFEILDLDAEDARAAGEIRAALGAKGLPIGPYDVLIAGQALARDLTLITRNIREFARVSNLRTENWEN